MAIGVVRCFKGLQGFEVLLGAFGVVQDFGFSKGFKGLGF